MGSFLAPPNHPSLFFEVETDLNKRREHRGGCNLEYAIKNDCSWVDDITRNEAKALLDKWEIEKLPLESPIVKIWIRDCKDHMGHKHVSYVQKYYPEYNHI